MKKNRLPILTFFILIASDQAVKFIIEKLISPGDQKHLWGLIYLINTRANGLIFSENYQKYLYQIIIPLIVLVILCITLFGKIRYPNIQRYMLWALIAGGSSNIIDRIIREGSVIRFIHIKQPTFIPVFNIADFAVAISVVIMLISIIIQDRRIKQNE